MDTKELWDKCLTEIELNNVVINKPYEGSAIKYTFDILSLPLDGTYEFSIYGAQDYSLVVTQANVTIIQVQYLDDEDPTFPTVTEYPEENSEVITINANNSYIPPAIEVSGGDLPDI
ncbi:hypothetical protein EOM09_08445, partial [bacterium]|nr:hypothetical protein [bacterium]